MPDDNRLPTNQSQLDIIQAIDDVKTAINNLNFILDAQNIAYDSNTSVKEKIDDIGNIDTIIAPTNSATSSSYTLANYKAILFVLCNSTGKQVYATTIISKGLISNSIVTSTNVYATTSEADFTFTNSQINLTALSNTYSAVYGVK